MGEGETPYKTGNVKGNSKSQCSNPCRTHAASPQLGFWLATHAQFPQICRIQTTVVFELFYRLY